MKANTSATRVLALALLGVPSVTFAQAPTAPARAAVAPVPTTSAAPTTDAAVSQAVPAAVGAQPTAAPQASEVAPAPVVLPAAAAGPAMPSSSLDADHPGSASATVGGAGAVPAPSGYASPGPGQGGFVAAAQPPPPPPPAKTWFPLGVQLDIMPVWQSSKGFDLFAAKDISTRVGLSANYDLVEVAPKTPLAVELGWSAESKSEQPLFDGFETRFSAMNLHGGVRARHQLLPYLAPHVSLALGTSDMSTSFTVTGNAPARDFKTEKWVALGMLGVGLSAMLPVHNMLMPGISTEVGYLVSGSMPLRFEPKADEQMLTTSGASLGTLGRSGPYLRFGVFCRY